MASYANLHPKYIFGLGNDIQGQSCFFVEPTSVLYPAANTVVQYNTELKTQQFLPGVEKGNGVTALTVSPNKQYAAVAQQGEIPFISVYELKLLKKRKTLLREEGPPANYVSLAFTSDLVHLASLTAGPEYNVILWKWEKNRVIAVARTTGGAGPVYEISASSTEQNVLCAIGNGVFRFFRFSEGSLKPFGFQKGDNDNFLCHAWFSKGEKLIAGTANGRILFFERGDLRYEIFITPEHSQEQSQSLLGKGDFSARSIVKPKQQLLQSKAGQGETPPDRSREVTALCAYARGFIAAYGTGNVVIYEEQQIFETIQGRYKPQWSVQIPSDTTDPEDRIVTALTMSPADDTVVAVTANKQLFSFSLSNAEIMDPDELMFEYLNCSFHCGAIVALAVSIQKSLLVTAGVDRYLRVWNYVTLTQENCKIFPEEIYCLSFHPTGHFVLAGCVDKIRIYTLLLDDIEELQEFSVRACRECIYSNGGQFFAAANGNIIQVFSTVTFEPVVTLKGHVGKVVKLLWSSNDEHLYSTGSAGALYQWDVHTGKRLNEVVERNVNIFSVVTSPDEKSQYVINGKNHIREIQIADGSVVREIDLGLNPASLAISRSGRFLVATFKDGTVRSLKQPLSQAGEWLDYRFHSGAVNLVCITFDEIFCVTCSNDGAIIFWKITDPDGRVAKDDRVAYSSQVLVTKGVIEEREIIISELRQKLGELKLEMDYQLKQKDLEYQEEFANVNSRFTNEITALNSRIDELVEVKDKADLCHHEFLKEVGKKQEDTIQTLESHFNTKLITEFEKYSKLQNLIEETVKEYDEKIDRLESTKSLDVEEVVAYYEAKLKDKNAALECAYEEARIANQEGAEMKRQIEIDADQEILELTVDFERKLKQEKELNQNLKAEAGIMRKKFATMQKEMEDHKNHVQNLLTEGAKMKVVIQSTEKEIASLRKDLVDRDQNVQDKEEIIFDLKKTNDELEKFKFVLDYKIKELKKMIEPKDREILYLKQLNQDMEHELENTILGKDSLRLQVDEMISRVKICNNEYVKERRYRWKLNALVNRVLAQLSQAMKVLDDPRALKDIVKETYTKYGHSVEASKATNEEEATICELVRQKNSLEVGLNAIKRKLATDVQLARNEQSKILNENMELVFEINEMRRELNKLRETVRGYERAFGNLPSVNPSQLAQMKLKLEHAAKRREDIELDHNINLESKQKVIIAQQDEIDGLANKFARTNEI